MLPQGGAIDARAARACHRYQIGEAFHVSWPIDAAVHATIWDSGIGVWRHARHWNPKGVRTV
jgi:RES domain-containing protein